MRIIDYVLLEGDWAAGLKELVLIAINRGWQPLGGVAVVIERGRIHYTQAMVKYAD